MFSPPGVPGGGRGRPGQPWGNPGHLLREPQQPFRQEGSARKLSSDRLGDPRRRGKPARLQASPRRALTAPARHSTAPPLRAPGGSSPPPPSRRQAPATGAGRGSPPPSACGGRAGAAARPTPWRRPPCCPPLRPSRQSPAGPVRCKRLTEKVPVDGTRECAVSARGFVGAVRPFVVLQMASAVPPLPQVPRLPRRALLAAACGEFLRSLRNQALGFLNR